MSTSVLIYSLSEIGMQVVWDMGYLLFSVKIQTLEQFRWYNVSTFMCIEVRNKFTYAAFLFFSYWCMKRLRFISKQISALEIGLLLILLLPFLSKPMKLTLFAPKYRSECGVFLDYALFQSFQYRSLLF